MFLTQTTLRATVSVCAVLALSFVVTGFVSSAYKRERTSLGRTHFETAQRLQGRGDVNAAVEEYRKALLYLPDNADYRLSLATSLFDAGRLDEAQSHLEQLAAEDPTNGVINLMLARVAMKRKRPRIAVEFYQRAVYEYWPASQLPERRRARWELAELLQQTGNRNGYVGELMQLYANVPQGDAQETNKIGFLLLGAGATSEASQVFRDLLKSAPKNADGYRGLGTVDFNTSQFVSARHEFQRAIHLAPNDNRSKQMLALTNEVIDIDPSLAHVTSAERFRRSQNLLARVMHDVRACFVPPLPMLAEPPTPAPMTGQSTPAPSKGGKSSAAQAAQEVAPDPFTQRLDAADSLLKAPRKNGSDQNLELQDMAQQLWRDRAQFCPRKTPEDKAVEAVLGND